MRRLLLLSLFLVSPVLLAQSPGLPSSNAGKAAAQTQDSGSVSSSGVTLKANTQLIVVDVTVQDKNGNPVHGLKASDFQLKERKVEQTIKSFEEHTPPAQPRPVKMPVLPKGTFTDYSPLPDGSALNVILLDLLNTSLTDQAYVLDQLKKYVRNAPTTSTVAIYVLNSNLTVLQGFTSDPAVLKYVIDHKVKLGGSILLDDASGAGLSGMSASEALAGVSLANAAVANMAQAERDQASFEIQYRSRATLDAFNSIAQFLSRYPGRKNLIWFSGSFPFAIFPDETLEDPFSVAFDNAEGLRETTNLLDRARVAVYPIDARGVRTLPTYDAAGGNMATVHASATPTISGPDVVSQTSSFISANSQEHITMQQMADDTGGRSYYNLNDFSLAVRRAITDGANYYTLTYTPANHKYNGEFRNIHVDVSAATVGPVKLSYRHGYFAVDPTTKKGGSSSPILSGSAADAVRIPQTPLHTAMIRGGPAPNDVLFTARILPESTHTEDLLAKDNTPNPDGKFKGPFRRIDVDFAAVAKDVTLKAGSDGLRHGTVEFVAYVYDVKGKLLNGAGNAIKLDITSEVYEKLRRAGIEYRLQVSVPAATESLLRVAIHDVPSGHVGALEVASSDILRLPPLPETASAGSPAASH